MAKRAFTYSVYNSDGKFLCCFSSLFLAKINLCPGYFIIRKDSLGIIPDKKFVYGI